MGENELKEIKNLGKKSVDEINERLAELRPAVEKLSEEQKQAIKEKLETLKG